MKRKRLPPGYEIRELSNEEFGERWLAPGKKIFNDTSLIYDRSVVFSKKERSRFEELREKFDQKSKFRINLGLFFKGKFVGWSWGKRPSAKVQKAFKL